MIEKTIQVRHKVGLHARPAALFVQTASRYKADIQARNLSADGGPVDAKSIIMVLTLGVMKDHQVQIQAEGEDAAQAVEALSALIEGNFGEA
jgi:phosphotransferase system HPr (HPr) family protein